MSEKTWREVIEKAKREVEEKKQKTLDYEYKLSRIFKKNEKNEKTTN